MTNETARDRAERFITFCDGCEQSGLVDYARRGRVVARDCLEALDQVDGERSARRGLQARIETLEEILLTREKTAVRGH